MKTNYVNTIYVDCDETLVFWFPTKGSTNDDYVATSSGMMEVNKPLISHLKRRQRAGDKIVVWSQGGEEWATEIAGLVGLTNVVCLSKPNLLVDDLSVDKWMPTRIDPKKSYVLNIEEEA